MLLEQLIDSLCWCIQWIISEIHCLPERTEGEQQLQQEQQQRRFEYKEFPNTNEAETNIEPVVFLSNAASVSASNNNSVDFTMTSHSWFFPHKSKRGLLLPSIRRSVIANVTIIFAAITTTCFSGCFAYLDIETTDKCIGIEAYINSSIPVDVLKWKLVGESFQVLLINFWFSATIALLLGRKVFLQKFKCLLYTGLVMGLLVVIYKAYMYIFGGSGFRNSYNRYPANAIFLIGVILSCFQIAHVLQESRRSILLKIGQTFAFSFFMSLCYRYSIVPWFNEQTNGINKAMIAAIPPLFALIPVAVGKYVVLCHCSHIVEADASFVLIYFNYLVPVALYRIMQAELKDIRLFVAFSLLHGTLNIIAQVSFYIYCVIKLTMSRNAIHYLQEKTSCRFFDEDSSLKIGLKYLLFARFRLPDCSLQWADYNESSIFNAISSWKTAIWQTKLANNKYFKPENLLISIIFALTLKTSNLAIYKQQNFLTFQKCSLATGSPGLPCIQPLPAPALKNYDRI